MVFLAVGKEWQDSEKIWYRTRQYLYRYYYDSYATAVPTFIYKFLACNMTQQGQSNQDKVNANEAWLEMKETKFDLNKWSRFAPQRRRFQRRE